MALDLDAPDEQDGQTPLDPDEKAGLIPRHIETKGALNDWEQENILQATKWLRRAKIPAVLSEGFCRDLHRRMFNKTWKWAGTFRKSDKNIGCDWTLVAVKLNQLLGNAHYWVENGTFAPDELAARFHHALVWIHPFPNGNGRHARTHDGRRVAEAIGATRFQLGQWRKPDQRQRGAGAVSRRIARCGQE